LTNCPAVAIAIIQMPFKRYSPDTYASREDVDAVYHFHADDHLDRSPSEIKRQKRVKEEDKPVTESSTLALRLRDMRQSGHITDGLAEKLRALAAAKASYLASGGNASVDAAQKALSTESSGNTSTEAAEEPASPNESDFEVVQRPSEDDARSESDGDSGEYVKVEREAAQGLTQEFPIRTRPGETQPVDAQNSNASDSDSEWTLL